MKIGVVFFLFFLTLTLSAKELLVLSFDASKKVLEKRLPALEEEISSLHLQQSGPLSFKRFGDRYAIVFPVKSEMQKEKILLTLGEKYPHIFSIKLPDEISRTKSSQDSSIRTTNRNGGEWIGMILFGVVFAVLFAKGMREMMRVRRSQRSIQRQQVEMEKELKKEI